MSLDLVYVMNAGSATSFAEMPPAAPQIDDYGLDTLTRRYSGKNSDLDAFLATWLNGGGVPLNTVDLDYPGMASVGRPDVSRGRAWSEVSVQFKGKISNAEPLVSVTDSWNEGTTQAAGITGTTPAHQGSAIVDYRANQTSYHYYKAARPSAAAYTNGARGVGVAITTVATGADGIINTAAAHGLTAGEYILIAGVSGTTPNINGYTTVKAITDADTFTIETAVTVGGTGGTVGPGSGGIEIVNLRGMVLVAGTYYPLVALYVNNPPVVPPTFVPEQRLKSFTRMQVGLWWECDEVWAWELGATATITPGA